VSVALEPAYNLLHSLFLLSQADQISGLHDWVYHTVQAMSSEERQTNRLVLTGFYYAIEPEHGWPSFPAYVDALKRMDAVALRDRLMARYACCSPSIGWDAAEITQGVDWSAALHSVDAYLNFLQERFSQDKLDIDLEGRAYQYVIDPPAMQALIVDHLWRMWERYLATEWNRTRPLLAEAVRSFQQVDLNGMERLEAARWITGRTFEEKKWERTLGAAERLIFVPNAHVGPYLGKYHANKALVVVFGARSPKGARGVASDLSRAEIVVRLNALADDTRLRILRLVAENGELCAQDVIQGMDLTQSTASRHLSQLTATGYLSERRGDGGKYYALNPERVEDVLQAVAAFLLAH